MNAVRSSPRNLPLVPTLLCLLAAAWVSSAVASAAFAALAHPAIAASPLVLLVGEGLVGALVGAVVIRALLNNVVGCEISYGPAFIAVAAGSLVGNAVVWATSTALQHNGSPAVPIGGLVFGFATAITSMAVSYWLLQRGVRDRAAVQPHTGRTADPDGASAAWADDTPARHASQTTWGLGGASYDNLVSAAREASLGVVDAASRTTPAEVPNVISEGLSRLQSITANLESTTPPVAVPARVHRQLVCGMKHLQVDLVDTAASAVSTAADRITQRGWLLPTSVDVSDGGARYRWELSMCEGLKMVKEALSELNALGVGTSW